MTGTPPVRSPLRLFGWCLTRTWWLAGVGGAVCGALAVNVISLVFFPVTMVVGFLLGTVYGLPVVVAIAGLLSRQRPGPDPRRFVRTLQIVGAVIAVAVNGTTNLFYAIGVASPFPSGTPVNIWLALGMGALAGVFTAASGFVGWTVGATLAQRYLVKVDHPAATARQGLRRRRPWR